MSHKDAPPLSAEQRYFEAAVADKMARHCPGHTIGMGRDKDGQYLSSGMRERWALWQVARGYVA